ncbi:MAG: KH domain-containing protein [Chloroflexota bacterium]
MKELIEYIARSIVNAPDSVKVTEETNEDGTLLKLQVADDDKGRVIGKQGRVARAMRTLIRVKAAKKGERATLEII